MVTGEVNADWSRPNESTSRLSGASVAEWAFKQGEKNLLGGRQKRRGSVLEQGDQYGLDVGKDVLHPVAWVGTGTQQQLVQTL